MGRHGGHRHHHHGGRCCDDDHYHAMAAAYLQQQRDQEQYGGHPFQQQYPSYQYQTVQVDNAAQYAHDHIADRYLRAKERASAGAGFLQRGIAFLSGKP